jgi:predicted Ser/Thr protein kinase
VVRPGGEASSASRRYQLVEVIDKGGFGAVWRGKVQAAGGFEKTVAIKLLHKAEVNVDEVARRLRDEGRILALLRHRSIVQVDDLVQIDGQWAVVMEYVEGADLRRLLKNGPIPARAACEAVRDVAFALSAAHEAVDPDSGKPLGIVHRDMKPANVRVTPQGEVKVIDFGIARASFSSREAVTSSQTFGSPGYIAPERHDGRDTPAADVFSLGVVLYECLAGRRLGQLSVNARIQAEEVGQALAKLDAAPPVVDLVRRMLAYEPEHRPTAQEVGRQLRDLVPTLPGPWLADWVPDALRQLPAAKTAERALPAPAPDPTVRAEVPDVPTIATGGDPAPSRARWAGLFAVLGLGGFGVAGLLAVVLLLAAGGLYWSTLPAPTATVVPATQPQPQPQPEPQPQPQPESAASAAPTEPVAAGVPPASAGPEVPPARTERAEARAAAPEVVVRRVISTEGEVTVAGDADRVVLIDAKGARWPVPGRVPEGRYRIEAAFGSRVVEPPGDVAVKADGTIALRCVAAAETCRVK